jgi:hypothetical protein
MTREHAKELLPIITAFADGEDVQFRIGAHTWTTKDPIEFNSDPKLYRIAPKPRKIWVNEYKSGNAYAHFSKEGALACASDSREVIATHELELPPLP